MRFLCLAYEEQRLLDEMSREAWRELRRETLDYVDALRARGILHDAIPLSSATTSVTLQVRGERLSITDGPFAETKEQIGGLFVIEAEDRDAAVAIASKWPSARLGTIEVRAIEPELGEDRRY